MPEVWSKHLLHEDPFVFIKWRDSWSTPDLLNQNHSVIICGFQMFFFTGWWNFSLMKSSIADLLHLSTLLRTWHTHFQGKFSLCVLSLPVRACLLKLPGSSLVSGAGSGWWDQKFGEGRPVERGEVGARNMQFMELDSVQRWSVPGVEFKYLMEQRREMRFR